MRTGGRFILVSALSLLGASAFPWLAPQAATAPHPRLVRAPKSYPTGPQPQEAWWPT